MANHFSGGEAPPQTFYFVLSLAKMATTDILEKGAESTQKISKSVKKCRHHLSATIDTLIRPRPRCFKKKKKVIILFATIFCLLKSDHIAVGLVAILKEKPLRHFISGSSRLPLSCQKARQRLKWFNKTKYNIPQVCAPARSQGKTNNDHKIYFLG